MNVDSNLKKSRGNPNIYVTIKTSKEELHNLKLSLNQPTFNNCTKTLGDLLPAIKKLHKVRNQCYDRKKAIAKTILLKRRKETDKMKVEISRFQDAKLQRLYKCYGNFQR